MKEIKLTQGQITSVDDEDYDYLMQWKWYAISYHRSYRAMRNSPIINGKKKNIYMHRVIMKTPDHLHVDHIDHNPLNNQKSNLRNCTKHQNNMNSGYHGSTSGFKGVSYLKNRWIFARIKVNQKQIYLGYFKTTTEAAMAYDEAARKYFGEFANPNFK